MRVAVLASGGKDSTLALHHVLTQGHNVACLASMAPLKEDSWMFHYPNINLMDKFAQAVNIPLAKAETSGEKQEEIRDLQRLMEGLDVEGIVSGAIASNYQKNVLEGICKRLGLECLNPLWGRDPLALLNETLGLGFETIFTAVSALGFDESWLGRRIDQHTVNDLVKLKTRYGVSIAGEGGEYETLVLDAAFFKKRIKIVEAEKTWKGQSGILRILRAELESK